MTYGSMVNSVSTIQVSGGCDGGLGWAGFCATQWSGQPEAAGELSD